MSYLPAYSPDLNPIEMAFSKLKAHLRFGPAAIDHRHRILFEFPVEASTAFAVINIRFTFLFGEDLSASSKKGQFIDKRVIAYNLGLLA